MNSPDGIKGFQETGNFKPNYKEICNGKKPLQIWKTIRIGCSLFYLMFFILLFYSSSIIAQPALSSAPGVKSAGEFEKMARVKVPDRPFLFVNKDEIASARIYAEKDELAKAMKKNYIKVAASWVAHDYDFIKKIVPPIGSIYTYGLGLNLDPVQQKRMSWRGWKDPRHVEAGNGIIYPNDSNPDDGTGWTDPATKKKYYFVALANGMTVKQLETIDLPALVNAYVLTGNEKYAERALWLLDAIATIYPYANEGPIDYPGLAPGKPDGGRLDRPYYQAARAMMNYAYFAEMLSTSTHAGEPSLSNANYSMLKNIEFNLLMNGADYCLRMSKAGTGASNELNNGNIDYNRAPLAVGAMLGITKWVDWALNGPLGFRYAVTNTIDINGRYFETGTLYAQHTRALLLSTAWFLKRMKLPSYPNGYGAYDDERFAQFALDFFTGIEVAGRLPLFGDSESDSFISKDGRIFDGGTLTAARQFYRYSGKKSVRDAALQTASKMLKDMPVDYNYHDGDIFHMSDMREFIKQAQPIINKASVLHSTLLFDYGTLILRSGNKENERAAFVRFGPTLNHGQADELGLAFYARGRDFSFDPGYHNTHLRFGFTSTTVAHNLLVVNRTNQLKRPSPGGDLQTWTNGEVLHSSAVNDPQAYSNQNLSEYKRRVALIDLSSDDSYIIDNFWACGGKEYDYSLHGITGGKLQILPSSKAILKETRGGSVLSPTIDYANEMDPNGRVNSYSDKPFYFAPPGGGYGFLSHPSFYALSGPIKLQWSSTDKTDHHMYVWQFAPPSAELLTAQSPKAVSPMDLTYALLHVIVPATETVRFTSVIHATAGENKLASVEQLLPTDGSKSSFILRLTPNLSVVSPIREHYYLASDKKNPMTTFDGGLSFSGEEGYLGLDASGNVLSASLTGTGEIRKGEFTFTVKQLFKKPLQILQVENQPLRILVNASYEQTKQLTGCIIRLVKPSLIRPYVLQVKQSKAAGKNSWLTLNASGNIHAVGKVLSYNPITNSIITDAPFPHTRPYTYTYSEKTGFGQPMEKNVQYDYNGGYNGFWLVSSQNPKRRSEIKNMEEKRTHIMLTGTGKIVFSPGNSFQIQLLAPGDSLEIPVWGQARRNANGAWQISGSGSVTISK
jgi:hypothetical protein